MTNTRITDIEIIEKRYPIILQKFTINPGTGGRGIFNGGNGVIREMMFRKNLILSVLTERRVFSPYGIKGLINNFNINFVNITVFLNFS
jgi:5-oxoprolinase (ATP-hydrolysing)